MKISNLFAVVAVISGLMFAWLATMDFMACSFDDAKFRSIVAVLDVVYALRFWGESDW